MHRSRVGVLLIDHPPEVSDRATRFWSEVVGVTPDLDEDGVYTSLGRVGSVLFETQQVGEGTESRIHLDVETDEVDSEVKRLQGLGAEIAEVREGYVIMRDPGGLIFCVVPVQSGETFEREATVWS
ncbi:MAG: glyoxalase/bleomycin resistance/dioxygenase family protein [Acidimicrobiia bacterium]|nr:glyoxalase/bleomycin resistance/dioxygenase family protein [Acidimicrobiia bacterium]